MTTQLAIDRHVSEYAWVGCELVFTVDSDLLDYINARSHSPTLGGM